ncbi:hypothetical protein ASG35_25600 [Burkholderia sp. Leaf177]|nr:hypothetical protein ASG35_25600 [Burkholderia sp. Leaf177]
MNRGGFSWRFAAGFLNHRLPADPGNLQDSSARYGAFIRYGLHPRRFLPRAFRCGRTEKPTWRFNMRILSGRSG